MGPAASAYQRLPGRGLRREGCVTANRKTSRIWLAQDHILVVDSTGYTEEYKRFYFKDVQAFLIRKSNRRGIAAAILGTLIATLTLAGMPAPSALAATLWIIAAVLTLFLLVDWLRGPTCVVHVQTAVQLAELPSLGRRRNAHRVLDRLRPLIEARQGEAVPDEVRDRLADAATRPGPAAPVGPVPAARPIPAPERGRVHRALFVVLLLEALRAAAEVSVDSSVLIALIVPSYAALGILVAASLARQRHTDLPRGVQRSAWASLAVYGVSVIVAYILYVWATIASPPTGLETPFEQFQRFLDMRGEQPWMIVGTGVVIGANAIIGLLGLFYLRRHRSKDPGIPLPPPQPAPPSPPPAGPTPPLES